MNFIAPAYAQAAAGAPASTTDMVLQFAPFLVIIVIMYFLILRPQRQRQKQHQEMISKVRRGDTMHRIASANAHPGTTLDQMLIALLRANPQAFDGDNINRLRAKLEADPMRPAYVLTVRGAGYKFREG